MRYSDLESRIREAKENGRFKHLPECNLFPDFQSNDVLGLAQNADLKAYLLDRFRTEDLPLGAGGSRSISGNLGLYARCELALAQRTGAQAALLVTIGLSSQFFVFCNNPQPGRPHTLRQIGACLYAFGNSSKPNPFFWF